MIAITWLLAFYAAPLTQTDILFIGATDAGIAAFNGYYIGNVTLGSSGVSASSTGQTAQGTAPAQGS